MRRLLSTLASLTAGALSIGGVAALMPQIASAQVQSGNQTQSVITATPVISQGIRANNIVLSDPSGNTLTLFVPSLDASKTFTFPNLPTNSSMLLNQGNQMLNGNLGFGSAGPSFAKGFANFYDLNGNYVSFGAANNIGVASSSYFWPAMGTSGNFLVSTGGGNMTWTNTLPGPFSVGSSGQFSVDANGNVTTSGTISSTNTTSGSTTLVAGSGATPKAQGTLKLYDGTSATGLNFQASSTGATGTYTFPTPAQGVVTSNASGTIAMVDGNNGVVVTDGTGVPSVSTTLPNGLTMNNATIGGTTTISTSGAISTSNASGITASGGPLTSGDATHIGSLVIKDGAGGHTTTINPSATTVSVTLPTTAGTILTTGSGVSFDVNATTQTSTTAANNLFDVRSAPAAGAALGGKIASVATGGANATGLSVTANAPGGTGIAIYASGSSKAIDANGPIVSNNAIFGQTLNTYNTSNAIIIGTTNLLKLSSIASTTRSISFPDLSGTLAMSAANADITSLSGLTGNITSAAVTNAAGNTLGVIAGNGNGAASNGGDLNLASGAGAGTGTAGGINIKVGGTSGTAAITINSAGQTTIPNANISGGTINGTPIGSTTASSGKFTSVTTPTETGSSAANGTLTLQGNSATSGNTASSANIQFNVGDNGATSAMTIKNDGSVNIPNAVITGGSITGTTITTSGALTSGTAGPSGTQGALSLYGGTAASSLNIKAASSASGTLTFATPAAGAMSSDASGNISFGTLSVANGGTGATSFTAKTVLLGNGTSAVGATNSAASSVLVTDASSNPSFSTTLPSGLTISGATISGATINGATTIGGSTSINTTGSITTSSASGIAATQGPVSTGSTGHPGSIIIYDNAGNATTINPIAGGGTLTPPAAGYAAAGANTDITSLGGLTGNVASASVASGNGNSLTLNAGNTAGGAATNGGTLNLASGSTTGSGTSNINIQTQGSTKLSIDRNGLVTINPGVSQVTIDNAGNITTPGTISSSGPVGVVQFNPGSTQSSTSANFDLNLTQAPASGTTSKGASFVSTATGAAANSTGVTISATGVGATATGLKVSASGATTNKAIDATGDVSVVGNLTMGNSSTAGSVILNNGSGLTRTLSYGSIPANIASAGANSDITSLTGLTTPLAVNQGGSGGNTFTAKALIVGNGTSAMFATNSAANSVLVTNGTSDPSLSTTLPTGLTINGATIGGATTIGGSTTINTTGAITTSSASGVTASAGPLTSGDATHAGSLVVNNGSGATKTLTYASFPASGNVASSGANSDITSLTGLTTALSVTEGGTGVNSSTLGSLVYGSGSNTNANLAGNTSATKKFLTQTGNGTVSAAPAWGTIANTDVSGLGTMSTQGAGAVAITGGAIDGTPIGSTTASTGKFTSVISPTATGSSVANGTLTLQGNSAAAGNTAANANMLFNVGNSGATTAMTIKNDGSVNIPNAVITGGSITGTTITTSGALTSGTAGPSGTQGTLSLYGGTAATSLNFKAASSASGTITFPTPALGVLTSDASGAITMSKGTTNQILAMNSGATGFTWLTSSAYDPSNVNITGGTVDPDNLKTHHSNGKHYGWTLDALSGDVGTKIHNNGMGYVGVNGFEAQEDYSGLTTGRTLTWQDKAGHIGLMEDLTDGTTKKYKVGATTPITGATADAGGVLYDGTDFYMDKPDQGTSGTPVSHLKIAEGGENYNISGLHNVSKYSSTSVNGLTFTNYVPNTGGTYGTIELSLRNKTGQNGLILIDSGNQYVADLGFVAAQMNSGSHNELNFRFEGRSSSQLNDNNNGTTATYPEFQFIDPYGTNSGGSTPFYVARFGQKSATYTGNMGFGSNHLTTTQWDQSGTTTASAIKTAVDIDGGLSVRPTSSQAFSSNNQTVAVGNASFIILNPTGTLTGFALPNGLQTGQMLVIEGDPAATGTASFARGSNLKLSSSPLTVKSNAILTLIWDGTAWQEISYQSNS